MYMYAHTNEENTVYFHWSQTYVLVYVYVYVYMYICTCMYHRNSFKTAPSAAKSGVDTKGS